jgi:hypothetical protein
MHRLNSGDRFPGWLLTGVILVFPAGVVLLPFTGSAACPAF